MPHLYSKSRVIWDHTVRLISTRHPAEVTLILAFTPAN